MTIFCNQQFSSILFKFHIHNKQADHRKVQIWIIYH